MSTCLRCKPCEKQERLLDRAVEDAGVGKRYSHMSFAKVEHIGVPSLLAGEYAAIKKWASEIGSNAQGGHGLMLAGGVGTLKTTLATCIVREAIRQRVGVVYLPMPVFVNNLFSLKGSDEYARFENSCLKTRLLVLDDFGAEYSEKWILSKIDWLICTRYESMRSVVITTNLALDQLGRAYTDRIVDRLRDTMPIIAMKGGSQRGRT